MIVIVLAIIGAVIGTLTARRREGNRLDKLQYGTVYGLAFALVGLFATVVIDRML